MKDPTIFTVPPDNDNTLNEWREYQQSLTDKLQFATGSAQLQLLTQGWVRPSWWDLYFLQLDSEQVFSREILMKSGGIDYWYAKTIIPEECYRLEPSFFNRLSNETMRDLIFNEKKVIKKNRISYPINQQCSEFFTVKHYLPTLQGTLWARCAEFGFLQQESFYLLEVLLPSLASLK